MRGQIKEHIQESMQAQVAEAATEHAPAASSSQRYSSLQDLTGQCLRDRSSDTSSRHSTSALNAPKAQVPRRPRPGQSLGVSLPKSRYAATTQETRQTSLCTLRQPEPREDPSASRSPRRPGIHAHTQTHKYTQKQTHNHKQKYTHSQTHTDTQTQTESRTNTHRHTPHSWNDTRARTKGRFRTYRPPRNLLGCTGERSRSDHAATAGKNAAADLGRGKEAALPQSIRPRRAAQGHQAQRPLPGETRTLQRRINMHPDRRRPMRTLGRKAGTDSEQRRKEEVPKSVHLLQGPEVQSQRRLPADAERERHPARARHLPENQDTTTERRRRFRRGKIAAGQGSEHRGQPDPSVAKPPCAFHHDRHAKLSKEEDHTIYSTSRLACQEHFRGALQLIPMTGDGNCLFHALAYRTRENAVHLRKDIIQFLRDAAQDQHDEEQEEAWLEEAAYLRGNANWGGDTAIVAFTLMRNQRVMLHWRGVDHRIHTDERTHRNVTMNLDAPDEDITHLWYNGEDHYDLLLPKPQSQAAAPAPDGPMGEGPPPPPPAPHAEPRPPKRNKTKAQRPAHQEPQRSSARPEPATASWSAEPQPEEEETLLEELTHIQVASDAAHPRRKLEDALRHLAETHLREQPLVPPEAAIDNVGGLAAGLLRLRALHVVLRSRHRERSPPARPTRTREGAPARRAAHAEAPPARRAGEHLQGGRGKAMPPGRAGGGLLARPHGAQELRGGHQQGQRGVARLLQLRVHLPASGGRRAQGPHPLA